MAHRHSRGGKDDAVLGWSNAAGRVRVEARNQAVIVARAGCFVDAEGRVRVTAYPGATVHFEGDGGSSAHLFGITVFGV